MENFLPALLIIGGIVYKIYTEFQKEQEKARQRRPNVPTPERGVAQQPAPPRPSAPLPDPVARRAEQAEVPQEVWKERGKRKKRLQEIPAVKPLEPEEGTAAQPAFDLRQAIIQSAILNRPQF